MTNWMVAGSRWRRKASDETRLCVAVVAFDVLLLAGATWHSLSDTCQVRDPECWAHVLPELHVFPPEFSEPPLT